MWLANDVIAGYGRAMHRTLAAMTLTLALLAFAAPASAGGPFNDIAVSMSDAPDPVAPGANITYTITVTNDATHNEVAPNATLTDALPAGTTFQSVTALAGWTCTMPAVGASGTVSCSKASMAIGEVATFTLVLAVDAGVADGTVISNSASGSSAYFEMDPSDNTAPATTTVDAADADLGVNLSATPDPVLPGGSVTSTITVDQAGPDNALSVTLTSALPPEVTFTSLSVPSGWTCTVPPAGGNGTVSCSRATFAPGSAVFTLVTDVAASTPSGSSVTHTASVSSTTADATSDDLTASDTTAVGGPADLRTTVSATPDRVEPGSSVTYAIVVINDGPHAAADATLTDVLPAGTTFLSLARPAGWSCTTPVVGAGGTVQCDRSALAAGVAQHFTLVVAIGRGVAPGTEIANTATAGSAAPDPDTADRSATARTTVVAAPTNDDTLSATAGAAVVPVAGVPTRRLICGRVPTLVRHSISGARFILARDGCRVRLRWVGRYRRGGRKRNRITSQSVKAGTPLYEGAVLTVRINGRRRG